jgi:hypothetical protein
VDLEARCRELFEAHLRKGFGGTFHVPDPTGSPSLRSQDSGYHALVLHHLAPDLAVNELRTLYGAAQLDDGLVVLECPSAESEDHVRQSVERFGPLYREDGRSWLIDPPVAAYAAARLAAAGGAGCRDILECATRQLDAIWAERLPPDTNLPVILHPFESGAVASPLYDDIVDTHSVEEWSADISTLTRSAVACRFDVGRALQGLGEDAAATRMRIRAEMIAEAITERLWWEEEEIFVGFDRQREEPMRVVTAGGLLPAATRSLLEEGTGKRSVERYLRPSGSPIWGPKGISFNPVDPHAEPESKALPWRGNVVLGAVQYWGHLALVRAQRPADAKVARSQLEERIEEQGFRECYDAVTGEGGGAGEEHGFTWPALVLEMRVTEP